MALPRTFVGFSSTDIDSYRLMCAWKVHEHIYFNFCDCQLQAELYSEDENYIKRCCRERINMAGTYALLIGEDTRSKHKYVRWEAEVAIEKECRLIGVNLDKWRGVNDATCPAIFKDVGAIFVPFSPQIVAYALEHWKRPQPATQNWAYPDAHYQGLGYVINGNSATRPPKPNPFAPPRS